MAITYIPGGIQPGSFSRGVAAGSMIARTRLAKQREKSEAAYRENLGKLAVARALEIGELLDPKKQRMIAEG
ncbi:MAG: hypothetical protein ACXAEN_25685, partial [Candidatus Thorarchaeota archaeon]